ncbi:ArsR/SmtB family transcription factor [Maricaulis sp.]|uniref:ArsR/SmtB family transcription factor n=1 Tax=Maricaulis sp. TaxID=1486257 RepID=UPI003A8FA498
MLVLQFAGMTNRRAVAALAGLSHPVRLDLFRHLCARYPLSVSAGDLAAHHEVPRSTMTGHLQTLERAGLIRAERRSQFMYYAASTDGTRWLAKMIISDILGDSAELTGHPERSLP